MAGAPSQRIDKWLWHARIVKTRTGAQKLATSGRVRVNREKTGTSSQQVRAGDVLTITLDGGVKVLRVVGFAERRGPAAEAVALYEDLSPPPPARTDRPALADRDRGGSRPTWRARRATGAVWGEPQTFPDGDSAADD